MERSERASSANDVRASEGTMASIAALSRRAIVGHLAHRLARALRTTTPAHAVPGAAPPPCAWPSVWPVQPVAGRRMLERVVNSPAR